MSMQDATRRLACLVAKENDANPVLWNSMHAWDGREWGTTQGSQDCTFIKGSESLMMQPPPVYSQTPPHLNNVERWCQVQQDSSAMRLIRQKSSQCHSGRAPLHRAGIKCSTKIQVVVVAEQGCRLRTRVKAFQIVVLHTGLAALTGASPNAATRPAEVRRGIDAGSFCAWATNCFGCGCRLQHTICTTLCCAVLGLVLRGVERYAITRLSGVLHYI